MLELVVDDIASVFTLYKSLYIFIKPPSLKVVMSGSFAISWKGNPKPN
jgi:hypothetical protein